MAGSSSSPSDKMSERAYAAFKSKALELADAMGNENLEFPESSSVPKTGVKFMQWFTTLTPANCVTRVEMRRYESARKSGKPVDIDIGGYFNIKKNIHDVKDKLDFYKETNILKKKAEELQTLKDHSQKLNEMIKHTEGKVTDLEKVVKEEDAISKKLSKGLDEDYNTIRMELATYQKRMNEIQNLPTLNEGKFFSALDMEQFVTNFRTFENLLKGRKSQLVQAMSIKLPPFVYDFLGAKTPLERNKVNGYAVHCTNKALKRFGEELAEKDRLICEKTAIEATIKFLESLTTSDDKTVFNVLYSCTGVKDTETLPIDTNYLARAELLSQGPEIWSEILKRRNYKLNYLQALEEMLRDRKKVVVLLLTFMANERDFMDSLRSFLTENKEEMISIEEESRRRLKEISMTVNPLLEVAERYEEKVPEINYNVNEELNKVLIAALHQLRKIISNWDKHEACTARGPDGSMNLLPKEMSVAIEEFSNYKKDILDLKNKVTTLLDKKKSQTSAEKSLNTVWEVALLDPERIPQTLKDIKQEITHNSGK